MKEVHGLLRAAELALQEATKSFSAPLVGSPEDSIRTRLANIFFDIEMIRHRINEIELGPPKTA